jgi:K+-transporting ATPase ATPase B chain
VEVAGDVDTLLLDKTGTITVGNRRATQFVPFEGYAAIAVGRLAAQASAADQTPEGKSIVELFHQLGDAGKGDSPHLPAGETLAPAGSRFIAFTAQTRMSGIDLSDGSQIRKGAPDAIFKHIEKGAAGKGGSPHLPPLARPTGEGPGVRAAGKGDSPSPLARPTGEGGSSSGPAAVENRVAEVAAKGATPLLVSEGNRIAGMVVLEDILKPGITERFARLRRMGLRTVMVTGDNPLTAAAIAAQAGVDDFLAEATPEAKLAYIRKEQAEGKLVAMMGDGTNDAPALAQADVGVAMNSGTQAAKEAGNMVDLDSDPTKLIETVEIGKQLLMTRGALTTFSIANDVAKYFAIVPAMFAATLPWLKPLDIMNLHSATSAILSAVIFNAIIILLLIPTALKGVRYRPVGADALLRRNLLIWGLGGVIAPFIGIKLIDLALVALHLA